MMLIPFTSFADSTRSLSPAERARREQAFYDHEAHAEPWIVAVKRFAPLPLMVAVVAGLAGLSHALS